MRAKMLGTLFLVALMAGLMIPMVAANDVNWYSRFGMMQPGVGAASGFWMPPIGQHSRMQGHYWMMDRDYMWNTMPMFRSTKNPRIGRGNMVNPIYENFRADITNPMVG